MTSSSIACHHRRLSSLRDPERGRDGSSSALLYDVDDTSSLPDPDDYHKISLQSFARDRDPLEGTPSTPLTPLSPSPGFSRWVSQLPARFWKRRKSDGSDWRLSGETLISSWQEKQPSSSRHSLLPTFLYYIRQILIFLLPSFIQARFFPTEADLQPRKTYPTGYLDGLRGLAALFVFFFHTTNNIYDQVMYSYGGPLDEDDTSRGYGPNNSLLQLPIIKIVYSGPMAVSIFFIVSGFALSIKPVKQMRARDEAGLLTTLQSAIFRRPLRLFLPCFLSTFLVLIMALLRLFEATRFIAESEAILTGRDKAHIVLLDSLGEQLSDWLSTSLGMVKFFYWGHGEYQGFFSRYDTHLWTIPIELRASLALFLTHVALSRFRPGVRIALTTSFLIFAIYADRWEMLLFWGGFLLADLNQGPLNPSIPFVNPRTHRLYQTFLVANFVSGLYLASYPDKAGEMTPGYMLLSDLIPPTYTLTRRFWQGIGGLQIVLAVSSLPALGRLFASPIPHYLGQISYALYLVHALVNHTIGYWLFYAAYLASGGWATEAGKRVGFAVALCLDTVVAIWVADVFWRVGDRPCVGFARWVEGLGLYVKG